MLRLKYDAAQTTTENARHWSMADSLSIDGSLTPEIRRTLRNRSRYEVANNSYARGLTLTLADICIGTGPRLQMLTDDDDFNTLVEWEFIAWCESIRLRERLQTLRVSKITDGEAFAAIVKNPRVRHPVEIDIRPIESDRITTPYPTVLNEVDGIEYDRYGNPLLYHVSSEHPGDSSIWYGTFESISSDYMLHWYRSDRPGQSRGMPEILPALPLFAQLRRYTLAVLAAAETAADFAAVLYTDSPANGEAQPLEPLDIVALEKRMATTLPDGWKLGQIRAEHPNTTYSEFKREILGEIGRCMQMPVNILLGDSSKHNYASGRLDHLTFFKSIKVEQTHCEQVILNPVFDMWYREAIRIGLFKPPKTQRTRSIPNSEVARLNPLWNRILMPGQEVLPVRCWFWDGLEHVDPTKEAKAAVTRVDGNISNLAIECAKNGHDWEDVLIQKAREKNRMIELGLKPSDLTPEDDTDTDTEDEDEEDFEIDEPDAPSDSRRRKRKRSDDD